MLPSPDISEAIRPQSAGAELSQAGLHIERPRSALHSGDFTEGPQQSTLCGQELLRNNKTGYDSGHSSWFATSPPRHISSFLLDQRFPLVEEPGSVDESRYEASSLSSSYSSSFILKPPTSPLVQSESNEEFDFSSGVNPINISSPFQRTPRRHTMQIPHGFTPTSLSSSSKPLPHLRRDTIYPYQAHQPRRSLTSSPQTPAFLRPRRTSYASDSSPLHHASMVGSYEESILRGRMSTNPSKPLDFVAQIGVLGLGKCKSSLKCPAHVTLPFPAVFYSYETTTHGRAGNSEDGPSPYVGQIDLENGLPSPEEARDGKRRRVSANAGRNPADDLDAMDESNTNQLTKKEVRRAEKQKRRSNSPKAPPGGSYRIPEKGQLQIIIKNPNKTAVKLFLVPYDLAGMEPGTKTFIRQRSHSAGPIIDSALSSTSQMLAASPLDRPILRYLIHLHICSPSRGRFYLYKSIRVVFANRVPDGKEKLRNEISLPDPRFSVYKPGRDSNIGVAGANLAAEKAYRRRSSGFPLTSPSQPFDAMDGIAKALHPEFRNGPVFPCDRHPIRTPIQSISVNFAQASTRLDESHNQERPLETQSSSLSQRSQMALGIIPTPHNQIDKDMGGYNKLNKGDAGYGGNAFTGSLNNKQLAGEGLLAKKLRDLGVCNQSPSVGDDIV